jgi:hypothetical protein
MFNNRESAALVARSSGIGRGTVARLCEDLSVVVVRDGAPADIVCDRLETGGDDVHLAVGDAVLIWESGNQGERGVLFGRIGPSLSPPADKDDVPEEVVVEASETLVLRVGDGSIALTADGRILIKGTDLVSHATRLNRVKGGAVAIN